MASKQLKVMNELYASIKERVLKPNLDLATNRDIVENLHLAASEPEAVTYAEVDADGVPALWCIPLGSDPARVLLHSHPGGSVVTSMHTDRKAIGHIAKVVGVRALVTLAMCPTAFRSVCIEVTTEPPEWLCNRTRSVSQDCGMHHIAGTPPAFTSA